MEPSATPPAESPAFDPPLVIGLIGGIAAGKSAVARAFGDFGLGVVDADRVAREVVAAPAIRRALRAAFGDGIFTGDDLDRAALARRVFGDAQARRRLEEITHPAIRAEIMDALRSHLAAGRSAVLDAPLLLEGGLVESCHWVVFVDTPLSVRQARARDRGWADDELARREAAQLSVDVKSRAAHATIENGGSLTETRRQVAAFLQRCASTPPPATPEPPPAAPPSEAPPTPAPRED